jgi:hypothetical protein
MRRASTSIAAAVGQAQAWSDLFAWRFIAVHI